MRIIGGAIALFIGIVAGWLSAVVTLMIVSALFGSDGFLFSSLIPLLTWISVTMRVTSRLWPRAVTDSGTASPPSP